MSEHYYPDPPRPANSLAVVSLILGIASYSMLPLLGAIGAVITGHMAKQELKADPARYSGDGLATAGLILGYTHLVFILISIVLVIIALLMLPALTLWVKDFIR
jgi:hypothetical protein